MNNSELPVEIEITNQTRRTALQVAMKRGAGSLIDIILSASMALIPTLFHLISVWLNNSKTSPPIRDDITVVVSLCLAITPIPLIYLRIVFHKVLKTPTPGEIFSRLTVVSTAPNGKGIEQEVSHAIWQFFVFVISTILGLIFVGWCVYIGHLGAMQYPSNLIMIAVFLIYSFTLMAVMYCPRSSSMYQSIIDDHCKVVVKRLR